MKGKKINVSGWQDLIENLDKYPEKPKGYSTAYEITERTGRNRSAVIMKLKKLRENGKIKAILVRNKGGRPVWAYKD